MSDRRFVATIAGVTALSVVVGAFWIVATMERRDHRAAIARELLAESSSQLAAAEQMVLQSTTSRDRAETLVDAAVADRKLLEQEIWWHRQQAFLLGVQVADNSANTTEALVESIAGTDDIALTEEQIAVTEVSIAVRRSQADLLRQCLAGVGAARTALAADDNVGAGNALDTVRAICQEADRVANGVSTLFPFDFPDPYVLVENGRYWAYATNAAGGDIQTLSSVDGMNWSLMPSALPQLPVWADPHRTWAPSVLSQDGRFILFYTVRSSALGRDCISAASSADPGGPFVDVSAEPLICDVGRGGSIDPSPFVDTDGRIYLTWKSGDVIAGHTATLYSQEVQIGSEHANSQTNVDMGLIHEPSPTSAVTVPSTVVPSSQLSATTTTTTTTTVPPVKSVPHPAGFSLLGDPTPVLTPSMTWDAGQIEGSSFVRINGQLWLLYSAHWWDQALYSIGKARCETPLGPCHQDPVPLLQSTGWRTGPGGPEVFIDPSGALRIAYHSWVGTDVGYPHRRVLHIDTLGVDVNGNLTLVDD